VGAGEAFGTFALVDDSRRNQRAEALEDGLVLALRRSDFYEHASGDVTLLQEVIRVLAKRLRDLVSDRPEEARVEPEGQEPAPEPDAAPAEERGPRRTAGTVSSKNA
jgi:CRP-like cAMP-binding protein